jgi:hypothetical protein
MNLEVRHVMHPLSCLRSNFIATYCRASEKA